MATTKQRLALAIHDFLSASLKDGTVNPEDQESIEVAQQGIADAFKIEPQDATPKDTQTLFQIYNVYEKMKGAKPAAPATSSAAEPTAAQKAEAETLKSKGNAAMAKKNYDGAIDLYTQALALVPGNPIFLSNRAAAHSASKDHESAKADAEAAVLADPSYTKAWSRLGLALFALGDAKGSMEAYQKGIDYEGNGGSDAMKKGYETAKRRVSELEDANSDDDEVAPRGPTGGAGGMPDLASMFGGGGGGGGMPDLSSIMSNPMFASMAQNLMSNPEMLNSIMSNPRMAEMAQQFGAGGGGRGGGGGMPDLSALMNDPSMAEMAKNLMGGGAGGAGRGRGAGS